MHRFKGSVLKELAKEFINSDEGKKYLKMIEDNVPYAVNKAYYVAETVDGHTAPVTVMVENGVVIVNEYIPSSGESLYLADFKLADLKESFRKSNEEKSKSNKTDTKIKDTVTETETVTKKVTRRRRTTKAK